MKCSMKEGLQDVWNAIGHDILSSWDCEGGDSPTLTGEDVAGVVADHVETYLPEHLLPEWKAASYDQKHAWLEKAFPKTKLYGF